MSDKIPFWTRCVLFFRRGHWVGDLSPSGITVSHYIKTWRGKIYVLDSTTEILCPSKRELQ